MSRSYRQSPPHSRRPRSVPPLPHPSWAAEPAPAGPPRTFSAAEFWRAVGF